MNAALITARGQGMSFKDNALLPILGRPVLAYPYLAAKSEKCIEHIFLSTDGIELKKIGKRMGMEIIDRPKELSLPGTGHLELIRHGLNHISGLYGTVDALVVMLGNVATHEVGIVNKCIRVLEDNPHVDSCVTVSERNEFHPLRAKGVTGGLIDDKDDSEMRFCEINPFLTVKGKVSTNRQDLENVYFLNHAVWALRPDNCFSDKNGQWPGPFIGNVMVGITTDHGIDIRGIEDVAFSEKWLINHGWTMNDSPYWKGVAASATH